MKNATFLSVLLLSLLSSSGRTQETGVAGSDQAAEVIKTFAGRGTLADGSTPTSAAVAMEGFLLREGFELELVAASAGIIAGAAVAVVEPCAAVLAVVLAAV